MRIDKCTAAMLETVLSMYEDEAYAVKNIPVLSRMTEPVEELEKKAHQLAYLFEDVLPEAATVALVRTETPIGGGSLPGEMLKSCAVTVGMPGMNAEETAARLREGALPIIVRVCEEQLLFDLRTMYEDEFAAVAEAVKAVLG